MRHITEDAEKLQSHLGRADSDDIRETKSDPVRDKIREQIFDNPALCRVLADHADEMREAFP